MVIGDYMKKLRKAARADSTLTAEARALTRALGAVLRKARTSRGVSRAELGSRLLIGPSTLQRMELGDPRVSLGYYLAVGSELGVPVLELQSSHHRAIAEFPGTPKSRAKRKRASDDWFA